MWLYDLNLAAVAYLSEDQPQGLAAMRGAVILAGVVMLALGALRQKRNLVFGPSRALAFRSFALFLIAGYLACLIMVAEALAYVGGDLARLVQAGFLALAAIPETLLESELFGHEKGAFTGAIKTTEGKIEQASGGTLFLDEVGDIPLPLQVKLLRFLQERQIERIGGRKSIAVDTRIVCATHQNLEAMIADGRFREDLFYRLAEVVVKIPALAERTGDAPLLAKAFLKRFAREMNPQVTGLAPDALAAIDAWHWPGNVRELENRVKRAVIMADGKLVTAGDLDLQQASEREPDVLNLKNAREQTDRNVIRRALARSDGNISNTARLLGISRPTLYDLLKQYGLHA